MFKKLRKLLNSIKEIGRNNPVKHCKVYKDIGCCHVDGILCNYPECNILKEYKERNGK